MVLTISVLGRLDVRRDGRVVAVPAGKASEVLVRLALAAGTVVSAGRLLDDLWGEDAVVTRRNTLQTKIVKLRKALGDASALVSSDGGYRLVVEPRDVDALLVVGRLAEVLALIELGDDAGAAELCASTRRLFRGELLAGAGDGAWTAPHRTRLEAARLQLVEIECAARLRLGEVATVVVELETAVASFPFQEGLWVLLLTALYRAGRQADALATYQRVRGLLADELGLEPGPQLRAVEAQVLAQDPALGDAMSQGEAAMAKRIGNLPAMATELVGRSGDVAEIGGLVDRQHLVEIVGAGGVGKTALALAVARNAVAPGGVWLARLETTTTSDEIVDAVIAALGVPGGVGALIERLKATETVIVLDNCEHVLDAVADLVQRLLDAAPRTRLLCTTQVPLGIDGEILVEVAPLGLSDAVELFTRRASAQRRNEQTEGAGEAIREVCRSLDGLPLAIELAAARTKTLSIAEIGRRLDDRFDLLADPNSRRPERRRALRATIGWSYDLLFPDDQRGLWALATFAGGATLPALEQVLQALDVPARTGIDVVGRLAARSLLIVDGDGDGGSTGTRYRLLDSIREFALDAMAEAGGGAIGAARTAHAAWFAELASHSTDGVRSGDQSHHLAVARAERSNVAAALHWCTRSDPLRAVTIANGFGWAWIVLGDSRGAQRVLDAIGAAGMAASASDRATALLLAGWFEASTGDLGRARDHIDEATALAVSLGDVELRARCAYYLAYVASHDGDFRAGLRLTDHSRLLYAGLDRPWDVAANALFATRAAISSADERLAIEAAHRARDAVAAVTDPWLHVRYEAMVGELARLQHRFDEAVEHIGRAAATSQRLGFLQTEAYQLASLGRAQCQAGGYEIGSLTLVSAITKAEATGDVRMAALARVHLGRVLRALGDAAGARAALEHAVAWHREAGGGEQAVLGESLLAAMNATEGRATAHAWLRLILDQAAMSDNAPAEVFALDALARIATLSGDRDEARALSARAEERMAVASHFIAERDRVDAPGRIAV